MSTNVRTDGHDLVTQHAHGTVMQPADPVLLKPKGDPGVAPHKNDSSAINNPAGTVFDHGTLVAHKASFLGAGQHAPIVMLGKNVPVKDGDNGFLSWAKTLYVESKAAVMDAVDTGVNSLWALLPAAVQNMVKNGEAVVGGMSAQDFKDAAAEDAQAMLDALMSQDTLIALGQTAALMGVSAIPVVGQLAGGAQAVMRIKSTIEGVAGAADELKAIVEEWSQPMSPAQLAAARKKLASWLIKAGITAILAALGKALPKLSKNAKGKENSTERVNVGQGGKATPAPVAKTKCPCEKGAPVIVASGEKSLLDIDFVLPGILQVDWVRQYRSGNVQDGWFGQGWSHPLGVELALGPTELNYYDQSGRRITLPAIAVGNQHFDAYEQLTLSHPEQDVWHLTNKGGLCEIFVRQRDDCWRLPLVAWQDRNANRVTLHYTAPPDDSFAPHRPYALTDSAGRVLRLAWDTQAHLLGVALQLTPEHTLPEQARYHYLARYTYSGEGDLTTFLDGTDERRAYHWRNHVLTGYSRADGGEFAAEYDVYAPQGRVTRSWHVATGEGLRFEYDQARSQNRVIDNLGRCTIYEYDERQDIIATTGPDGVRIARPFDSNGNPQAQVDALGRKTQYQFDERGNLTLLSNAMGAITRFKYNELDLPVQITNAANHSTQHEFDPRGNLIARIDALKQRSSFKYDAKGQLIEMIDARGGRKTFTWNPRGNLIKVADCSGQSTTFMYDLLGHLRTRTDALGQTITYAWDGAGRLLHVKEADGAIHQYQWSGENNLLASIDPLGHITRYSYDGMGRVVSRVDANGNSLKYQYDPAGRLITLFNENNVATRFNYDLLDNITDEIGFDGRHQRYCYNAAGELTHIIEAGGTEFGPGKVTYFTRDALGRLQAKHAEGDASCSTSYQYDILGQLTRADNPAAKIAFAYDPLGQLLSEIQTLQGSAELKLAHQYDELGNRIATTLPDGRVLNHLFYGSGHLHQINLAQPGQPDQPNQHQIIVDIERDALHRETTRSQGAIRSHYDYDPMGRLLRHRKTSQQQVLLERGYRYDLAGNLLEKIGQARFKYDPVGRILNAQYPDHKESFTFDPGSNLLQGEFDFPIPDNRVRMFEGWYYQFDIHGNVTNRKKISGGEEAKLTWNADNQLQQASVTRNGVSQTTSYEYDALGRRTRKRDAFGQTEFLWDGDLMIHSQRGSKQALFIYEPNSFVPLATLQGGETFWYQCDQIGTPQELTDKNGAAVWAAQYKVWGVVALLKVGNGHNQWQNSPEPMLEQPFRFQGQQFDEETGLHYNRFRYYDPQIGRFVSQDPIGLLGGENSFQYGANPFTWLDPLGEHKKGMGVQSSGHHAPAVRKSVGRPFEMARSDKCWPTMFPLGNEPEHDHWKLHQAERKTIGPRQGDFKGTDAELFTAYEKAYRDKALKGVKVDLRSPDGSTILASNVSPLVAIREMKAWLKEKGKLCSI